MKNIILLFCTLFIILVSGNNIIAQTSAPIRFGKSQLFKPYKNEKEKKIDKITYKAYLKIFPDTLEVPLNRNFESESSIVFVGVSFKYDLTKLYNILTSFSTPTTKELDVKNSCFYIQGYCGKVFVNRYAYWSKKDQLLYILNYSFLENKPISLTEFKKIVTATLK